MKSYSFRFFLVFGFLCAFAVFVAENAPTFRGDEAIKFDHLKDTEVVISTGLSRSQRVYLKIGFLENIDSLKIAILGNHQIKYFSSEAFGGTVPRNRFFNFWGAASALADNMDYLLVLEKYGVLPDKIIVHITTPNNDNGNTILGHDYNMSPILFELGVFGQLDTISKFVPWAANIAVNKINDTFNYITFLTGLVGSNTALIVDLDECEKRKGRLPESAGNWKRILPNTVRSVLDKTDTSFFCKKNFLRDAFTADGSSILPVEQQSPVLDRNPLREERRALNFGDDVEIAKLMRKIDAIANQNGKELLFLVPPVYETERKSTADEIFSKALNRVPDLRVLDHRYYGRGRPELFYKYDHPNVKYYKEAIAAMRAMGFLD